MRLQKKKRMVKGGKERGHRLEWHMAELRRMVRKSEAADQAWLGLHTVI